MREYALTALAKLEPKLAGSAERIRAAVAAHRASPALEVQTRSVEYSRLLGAAAPIGKQVRAPVWSRLGSGSACR